MDRRRFLLRATVTAGAASWLLSRRSTRPTGAASPAPAPALADLGLPAATLVVDDAGFTPPTDSSAGRLLLTVENAGEAPLHFFAARIPDAIADDRIAADLAGGGDPDWFDMSTLPMLGNPDWPPPGGRAQAVVDLEAGRWLLVDPIDGRPPAVWRVAEPDTASATATPPEPVADVEIELVEMAFDGLPAVVPAGPTVWKIANRGAMEHELLVLPVAAGTTAAEAAELLDRVAAGEAEANAFMPMAGQGVTSAGAASWQAFDLPAGFYAAVCMTPMPGEGFVPHAMAGMVATFEAR
jgi:hypothetical protein